jgi:hypothetical protein
MENENIKNTAGNTILLTVIGVATLLVALVGATFAYFTATVTNNSAQSFSVTTASPVALVYTGGTLSLTNAIPGNSAQSSFTVQNPSSSTVAQTYDLSLVIDSNGFNTTDGASQLVLSISASGTTSISLLKSTIDLSDGTTAQKATTSTALVNDQRIAIGETQTYSLTLEFKELNKAQNNNQGKSFSAHILLNDTKSVN